MTGTLQQAARTARLGAVVVVVGALLAPAGGLAASGAGASAAAAEPVRVRKDVADLTAAERKTFVEGLLALKRTPSPHDPTLSWYDQFVAWHVDLVRCDPTDPLGDRIHRGHSGPAFLPWHRYYVVLLERALQSVTGKAIAVPYWDWTSERSTKATFTADFMGGDGDPEQDYAVVTGAFRKGAWPLKVRNDGLWFGQSSTDYVTRHFGSNTFVAPTRPSAADVAALFGVSTYDAAPWDDSSDPRRSFRNAIEGGTSPVRTTLCTPDGVHLAMPTPTEARMHNRAHAWVGGLLDPSPAGLARLGTLAANMASPNDPTFFLLHSNVDRLWATWQGRHGTDTYRPLRELPKNGLDDVLVPLQQAGGRPTPRAVADIGKLGYRYAIKDAPRSAPVDLVPTAFTCTI